MTVLAFDTSMAACSAAILHDGAASPIQCFERMERGHAEALFPMVEAVMAEAGCGFGDLTKLAVTVGPGSFTGVRAGVAAARGFALAAKLPVVAATSLEVMARGLVRRTTAAERGSGFMVAHDARRDEFYVQSFTAEGEPLSEPELCVLCEAADALLPDTALVVGSGAAAIALEMARHGRELRAGFADLPPEAGDLAAIAVNRSPQPQHRQVAPLYLRAPDAKPQTDKSLARAG
jgi:tRNA threonylcarbamoyladenosine biosynthesis protein TsaB